jgi:DNA-binding FadR family transcriptional regulator
MPPDTGTVPRSGVGAEAKRAAKVADRIVEDVTALGWPVGHVLGSEADLVARYRVSRAVFREAVRLVEHQQVARTRRGPGGGLVITEPTVGAVVDAVVQYLHHVAARLDEVFEARIIVEELACTLASERSGGTDPGARRSLVLGGVPDDADTETSEFHGFVAALSGNACLVFLVNVLRAVTERYSVESCPPAQAGERDASTAHAGIAEAIVRGDAGLARSRMRQHLQAEADHFGRRRSTRQLLPHSVASVQAPAKGAEIVAGQLSRFIVSEGLQPGQLAGTEHELMARTGVSRAVLREAVRLLEHQQVARMRRGPGGGLFVMAPGTDAVSAMTAIYLARQVLPLADVSECRIAVEAAAATLAAGRRRRDGAAGLEAALARGEDAGDAEWERAADDLHVAVAAATRNKVLHLVVVVLIRLSARPRTERTAPKGQRPLRAEVLHAHRDIARAIEDGQEDLAQDRMRHHLGAVGVSTP